MGTTQISIQKAKHYCEITRKNIKKRRYEMEVRLAEDYSQSKLKKHWWEFWKSSKPLTVEAALAQISQLDPWNDWRWSWNRIDWYRNDAEDVCDELEALCEIADSMITITSEQANELDFRLDP